jgi:hypothetical protein
MASSPGCVLALRSISAAVDRVFRLIARIRPDGLTQQTLGTGSSPLGPVPTVPDLGANDPDWRNNLARHLQAAMQAQAVLDQATGLLMGIHECNPEQARLLLGVISLHPGVEVADLAAGIVAAATASQTVTTAMGPNVMVAAGARAALSTRSPRRQPPRRRPCERSNPHRSRRFHRAARRAKAAERTATRTEDILTELYDDPPARPTRTCLGGWSRCARRACR